MSPELAARLVDCIGALLLLTMVLLLTARQVQRAIYVLAVQSLGIALAGAVLGAATHDVHLWITAGLTLLVKTIALPWLLFWVMGRLRIRRAVDAVVPITATLILAGAIVVIAFHLSSSLHAFRSAITGNALPVGVSLTLMGVLMMMARRKALVQMMGLFASENGIFFTAMAACGGMPIVVEIGVLLDVILGALVMGVLALRVRSSVDADVSDLRRLQG